MTIRRCTECDATMYEGGIRAFGRLFCSEDCADDFENDGPSSREIDELYPEWSGAMTTGGWDVS